MYREMAKQKGKYSSSFLSARSKAFDYCYFRILRRLVLERHPELIIEVNTLVLEEMSRHPKYGESLTA